MSGLRCQVRVRSGVRRSLLVALVVAAVHCGPASEISTASTPWPDTVEPAVASSARVYGLLTNGELVVADAVAGTIVARLTLATLGPTSEAHVMAMSPDRARLLVLVADVGRGAQIITVDAQALRIVSALVLPGGLEYRGLALGPASGALYVFANRGGDAIVLIIEPDSGTIRHQWTARANDGHNWLIYQGSVSEDETTIFLSYHGPDTTGIDRFEIDGGDLKRCVVPADPNAGCFRAHGGFAFMPAGLLAATGDADAYYLLDSHTGARLDTFEAHLPGNHLVEFALAPRVGWLYAVGSCGYSGGLSASDVRAHRVRVLASVGTASICGERIVLLDDASLLVVGKTRRPVPGLNPGELTVLSASGAVLHRIATAAEVVDLLLVR